MKTRAKEMGANAIVGVDLDYETIGIGGLGSGAGNMLMVSANCTAVRTTIMTPSGSSTRMPLNLPQVANQLPGLAA